MLVELEHLQKLRNSTVQQAGSARGLAVHRQRGRQRAVYVLHRAQWHTGTGHY